VADIIMASASAAIPANLRLFISSSLRLILSSFDYVISWNYIPVCPTYADNVQLKTILQPLVLHSMSRRTQQCQTV
jgi:hypothetical protein